MNIREISDIFKDTADNITAIKSYNFGWASDRVRQGNTEDFQELNEFPRVFFAVPTITGSDQTRKQDTYQVTLFFDDLLGYDNEGDEDPTLQIDKWANLQQYANYFIQRLNKIKQSILPNYLFIPEAPSITFDSFTGLQRMITVQLSFNLVVPTNCEPGVIALVQCIANIVTSSNLTASLTTVLKFAASLEGRATVTADINFVQKVASSLNASSSLISNLQLAKNVESNLTANGNVNANINFVQKPEASLNAFVTLVSDLKIAKTFESLLNANGTLVSDLKIAKNADANLSALASLSGDINFVQKAQASLLTSANVTGNLTIPKTFNASLLATGTTTADLTVNTPSVGLLLDLYPNAAAAYSLRKLRTAYSGSAIRVRRSSDNTEQNIGFDVNGNLDTTALTTFVGSGNGFVTTWYDQSGNARNAAQTTLANQPQIVSSGVVVLENGKNAIRFIQANFNYLINTSTLFTYQTGFILTRFITRPPYAYIIASSNNGNGLLLTDVTGSGYRLYNGTTLNPSPKINPSLINQDLIYALFNGLNSEISVDNSSVTVGNSGNNTAFGLIIGSSNTFANIDGYVNGMIQEIILYNSNQSANSSAIKTNINTHYAIY